MRDIVLWKASRPVLFHFLWKYWPLAETKRKGGYNLFGISNIISLICYESNQEVVSKQRLRMKSPHTLKERLTVL